MSLTVSGSAGHSCSCGNIDDIKLDPAEILSKDPVLEIFSYLNLATLGAICRVSRRWRQLVNANDSILWKVSFYREIAFGNDKWAQYFGTDVVKDEDKREEFSSLPLKEYIEDRKKFKTIFPEKKAKDLLMVIWVPKKLNGQLTLKSLGALAKKYFLGSHKGCGFIWSSIVGELGDTPIDKSRWVLMTKDVLPGSRDKSYAEQQKIVDELPGKSLFSYEVPGSLEAAACILSQYLDPMTPLLSDDPLTFTRCIEKVRGYQTRVGGVAPAGFCLDHSFCDAEAVGVAALRKF